MAGKMYEKRPEEDARYGCGPTSMAIVVSSLTGDDVPIDP